MAGKIGVSDKEEGTRGLWWEKRRALVTYLAGRGHSVDFVSNMTKHSEYVPSVELNDSHEVLMIEFGSSNQSFYGADLVKTLEMTRKHKGKIIFLNDDPDLPFIWEGVKEFKNWSCWYNAYKPEPFGHQPFVIPCYDFPFSSLMNALEPVDDYKKDALVYIGRPNGRTKMVKYLLANSAPWKVYGRKEEWEEFGIMTHQAPNQPQRAEFYQHSLGCVVLADAKHKKMGWRTGRAYHALMAGCPAVVEWDHTSLTAFHKFQDVSDLKALFHRWRDPDLRAADWKKQIGQTWYEKEIANKTLVACGL